MTSPGEPFPPAPPPPSPTAKKGPSCWLIGGLGCLVVIIGVGIAGGIFYYNLMHSATGQKITATIQAATTTVTNMQTTDQQMQDIHAALLRYRAKNGHYPKTLNELSPKFLADQSVLHSPLDNNAGPSHISYKSVKPSPKAPPSTEAFCISYTMNLGMATPGGGLQEFLAETLGGKMIQAEYRNGRLISRHTMPTRSAAP